VPWQTLMKTLILMQSTTFLQIIATWAEKLKARQSKMLLKTSINILSQNEEMKSQRADHGPHTPFLTLPSNTFITSTCPPNLTWVWPLNWYKEGKRQGLYSPGKLETNCFIKLLIFVTKLKITQTI
jgi:hypothetical protein